MKILITDDDENVALLLELYLKNEGFETKWASDGLKGLEMLKAEAFDLAIIDVMMPGMDGFEMLRALRAFAQIPVIMLTARVEINDRISGLTFGADDYVTKPFEPKELLLRIKAILRRAGPPELADEITFGDLRVNTTTLAVALNGERIDMTPKETEMLAVFMSSPGKLLTREELIKTIWGSQGFNEDSRTVDVHIKRIRRKLEGYPKFNIETVWGRGYKLEPLSME